LRFGAAFFLVATLRFVATFFLVTALRFGAAFFLVAALRFGAAFFLVAALRFGAAFFLVAALRFGAAFFLVAALRFGAAFFLVATLRFVATFFLVATLRFVAAFRFVATFFFTAMPNLHCIKIAQGEYKQVITNYQFFLEVMFACVACIDAVYETVLLHVQCALKRLCMAVMQTLPGYVSSSRRNTFTCMQQFSFVEFCVVRAASENNDGVRRCMNVCDGAAVLRNI
jgi:hypothetical protein